MQHYPSPGASFQAVRKLGTNRSIANGFGPDIDDSGGGQVFIPAAGTALVYLLTVAAGPPHGYADFAWGDITFYLPDGANSCGFSLHNMNLNAELFVNGNSQVNLRRLLPSGGWRAGDVRIDAGPGEVIESVKVVNSENPKTGDGLAFDHVAFKPLQR